MLALYLRAVDEIETPSYRTLFLYSDQLDQVQCSYEAEVPYTRPEAFCGCIRVGECTVLLQAPRA